ncbi:DoxX family protein [Longirhabdus pacifica]|uniref:DoxX family protein n=1 Tax=Longirhabdus pacifica TaxID=2305227 RepID=UPI0010090A15|nr:DoxX family protein [Longirhabdus pacifica]
MFVKFLRENVYASIILLVVRVYLGWEWLSAGWGKVTKEFDATFFLQDAVTKAEGERPTVQSWWASFLEGFAIPNVELFNFLVAWGEVLVGIALIAGIFTTFAGLMGIIMNFAYLFSGTTSTNPQMVLLTIFILVAGANAGRFGLDYYVLPFLRRQFRRKGKNSETM